MDRLASFNKLDIFTKIDSSFTRTTSAGGTVSLLTYVIIILLLFAEVTNYLNSDVVFQYSVDTDFDKKLDINIDITVATPCGAIGADILDSTNKASLYTYGNLDEVDTHYALSATQQSRWDKLRQYNSFLRKEHHNIHQLVWKPDALQRPLLDDDEPVHSVQMSQGKKPDSCRFHGTLTVNKVAGNFHISAGKYIPLPIGHAHVSMLGSDRDVNFTHRIEKFAFGDQVPFVVNTLDGVEKTTNSNTQLYQYYLKLVRTTSQELELYQYSVTERELVVNHNAGSHGMPGIYFKYEIDGLKVSVRQDYIAGWKFAVRLCAIVGGILAISGFINQVASSVVDVVTGRYIRHIDIH